MKLKSNKKGFKGLDVLKVGYCKLQYLLNYKDAFAYSSGAHGWACDYYDIDGVIISTGYNPIGKQTKSEIVEHYEKIARKTLSNYNLNHEDKTQLLDNLLKDFLNDANIYA